ncbi:MAG: hypothetical protein L3J20_04500 [Flavobacteriaceae bacterium]|nr:hypothetical protein [Flavobacteriaceae bacterium]
MKNLTLLILFTLAVNCSHSIQKIKKVQVTALKELPEPITNNAVSEGNINGKLYAFTFGGVR